MITTRTAPAALLLALAACGNGGSDAPPPPPPTPVSVVTLALQPVQLSTELPGRTAPFETSDVRPQVDGLIQARLFQEGDLVRQGQALYRIDSSPYQARVASARAALARATAAIASSAAQAQPLVTIQRLDPIYVDIQEPSDELLQLRQQMLAGNVTGAGSTHVQLLLETGSEYAGGATLRFADVTVDPTTGTQTIRAVASNKAGLLLPGMFVRAVLPQGRQSQALLVPQRAVGRDDRGHPTALIVGRGNKAELRVITTSRTQGDDWIVTGGLKPGDNVIVEGGMLLRPGGPVAPTPVGATPAPAPPQQGR